MPPPVPPITVKTPVDGLNLSLVDDTFIGKFPVVVVTQVGYISVAVLVSSVIPTLVALVAVVAVVADPAEPSMFTPVRDWLALDLFRAIEVVPIKRLELPNTPLGIVPDSSPAGRLVRLAPDPLKPVAVNNPVLGLKLYFVELT